MGGKVAKNAGRRVNSGNGFLRRSFNETSISAFGSARPIATAPGRRKRSLPSTTAYETAILVPMTLALENAGNCG
jgi:hypothetical protein